MLLDIVLSELAVALGLGGLKVAIRLAWPHLRTCLQELDFTRDEEADARQQADDQLLAQLSQLGQ